MNEKKNIRNIYLVLIIYYICLLIVWGGYTLLLKPVICNALGEETFISSFLRSGIIKNIVWTLPAALLITKFKGNCMVSLKDMFTKISPEWKNFLFIFPCFIVFVIISSFRTHGGLQVSESFGIDDIITVLFVGLTEELVFRGWLLNAAIKEDFLPNQQYIAIAINAVLFLCIHFPIWISNGEFVSNFMNLGFITIPVLSAVFSFAFIKTKNILLPITLHMFWDLLVFMLV